MLKKIAILCGAFLALFPYAAKADLDPSTMIQDKIVIINEELNKELKVWGLSDLALQELVTNRKAFEESISKGVKAYAMDKAMEFGSKIKIKQVTLSGVTAKIKGDRSNPELEKALGKKVTRKKQQNEDIKKTKKQLELINNMQVENVAVMYANALVARRAVIDEGNTLEEEEQTAMSDIPTITNAYKAVTLRADGRWIEILKAQSSYYKQLANIELVNLRVNEDEEDTDDEKKSDEESASGQAGQDGKDSQDSGSAADDDNSGMSLTDIYEKGKNTYDNVSSGNYSGALGNIADSAGGLGYGDAAGYISDAGKAYDTGKNAANNISQGNWSGVANDIAGGAADLGGKYGGEGAQGILNDVKSGVGSAGRAYDNVSSGNYGAALGNVVDGTANAMGDKLDGKTKNILSGASSGLNAADRVSNSISNGDWRSAVGGAVSGAGEAASKGLGGGLGSKVADDAAHNINAGINATTNAVNNFGNGNTVDGIMDIFDGMSNLQDTTGKD